MLIGSPQNKKYKLWKSLHRKKFRDRYDLFFIEGKKLFEEAVKSDIIIDSVILEEGIEIDTYDYERYSLKSELFKELSTMEESEGVLCICHKPRQKNSLGSNIIILDGIKDPGNAGTIIRSAEAFGFSDILFLDESVDPYNPKLIRGAMGSLFRLNIIEKDILEELKQENYHIMALDMGGKNLQQIERFEKIGIIVGNEAHGISSKCREIADEIISIPMKGKIESLNAGIAASITMFYINNFTL